MLHSVHHRDANVACWCREPHRVSSVLIQKCYLLKIHFNLLHGTNVFASFQVCSFWNKGVWRTTWYEELTWELFAEESGRKPVKENANQTTLTASNRTRTPATQTKTNAHHFTQPSWRAGKIHLNTKCRSLDQTVELGSASRLWVFLSVKGPSLEVTSSRCYERLLPRKHMWNKLASLHHCVFLIWLVKTRAVTFYINIQTV